MVSAYPGSHRDPERDVWQKEESIMDRLIHWSGTPVGVCVRKDSGVDAEVVQQGETTITFLASADHHEKVTCGICRRYEWRDWAQRKGVLLTNQGSEWAV